MKMCSSGFAPRRRQGGFIQGAILFALVIIAVVVAAFSLANRDSQSSADSEQARVNASFVLKVGNDLQTAVNRAVADGFPPDQLSAKLKFSAADATAGSGNLNLFDDTLKYMIRPQFPNTALLDDTEQPLAEGSENVAIELVAVPKVGVEDTEDAIVTVGNLKEDVCRRINVTANRAIITDNILASLALATAEEWREGCFGDNTGYTYFRVIATDVGPA